MRGARAVILCLLAALALSGCMRESAPVAALQPQRDLDSIAYGQSYGMAPAAMAYAGAAAPVRHDPAYHLDAGDRLRVVVFGQEGLTNTYAINAGGFSPRARRDRVTVTHTDNSGANSGAMRVVVPLGTSLSPGDTVLVGERWS
jgi:protein involved in polysaccharide export with SLBB domain